MCLGQRLLVAGQSEKEWRERRKEMLVQEVEVEAKTPLSGVG